MGNTEYRVRVRRGRVTIPKAIRETLGIKDGDELVIKTENNEIIIKPIFSVSIEEFDKKIKKYLETIRGYVHTKPRLGELSGLSLEDEFG
ncbi:AbrB/MazE/SpoVT family DNA-binding domain-containing protein [Vulcanisaeta distributa]|uniref:AbrB/MazE/SpoVT family DNA-binding domain-containing protein n=1 Tax=Vulcanisaeta distributa TaxID=164451 RepID=UPI0006CF9221|nr:AbrB/MazE/SpoVT family DNA-binding domain-containing protein [Vulcanisaeta distributa]